MTSIPDRWTLEASSQLSNTLPSSYLPRTTRCFFADLGTSENKSSCACRFSPDLTGAGCVDFDGTVAIPVFRSKSKCDQRRLPGSFPVWFKCLKLFRVVSPVHILVLAPWTVFTTLHFLRNLRIGKLQCYITLGWKCLPGITSLFDQLVSYKENEGSWILYQGLYSQHYIFFVH